MFDKLLTTQEVADLLRYTPEGLTQMRYRGNGPKFVKLGGKAIRYRPADINDWIEEQTRQQTPRTRRRRG